MKLHAALFHPPPHAGGFLVGDLLRFVIQRRLAEPLLEHAGGIEQIVGNDGVEHAHAAFIEHAHDRLSRMQVARRAASPSLAFASPTLTSEPAA